MSRILLFRSSHFNFLSCFICIVLIFGFEVCADTSTDLYKVEFYSAPLHENYDKNETQESKLTVTKAGKKKTFSFSMGCEIAFNDSSNGILILKCPQEIDGVLVTHELIQVSFEEGKKTRLVGRIVHLFARASTEKIFIGVRNTRELGQEKNGRELFILNPYSHSKKLQIVTTGYWLPSDADIELADEGKNPEDEWPKFIQINPTEIRFRPSTHKSFRVFKIH